MEKANAFGDLCIQFIKKNISLEIFKKKSIIYPCRSSELTGKFLDKDMITSNDYTLVGCNTSISIFKYLYPSLNVDFINICPIKSNLLIPTDPFITRCCKKELSGKIIMKNGQIGITVHWGASEYSILKSIRKLVKIITKKR